MITAERLAFLSNMSADMLTAAIKQTGYKNDRFQTAAFLGMTNGGEFCYATTYVEDGELHKTKVFVKYDPAADRVIADY